MRLGGRPVEKIVDDIMARLFASSVGLEGWPDRPHIVINGRKSACAGKQPRRLSPPGHPEALETCVEYPKPPHHQDGWAPLVPPQRYLNAVEFGDHLGHRENQ